MKIAVRRVMQVGAVGVIAGVVVAVGATPASARVTVSPMVTSAGSYTVLTFSVLHGCEGSATTKVSIRMPQEIVETTPMINSGWTMSTVMTDLNPPVRDRYGDEVAKRVAEVVYTATAALPDGYGDTFALSVRLPQIVGVTLVFPVVQTCVKGESLWVQVPVAGKSSDSLAHPAPSFVVTPAVADESGTATSASPSPAAPASGSTVSGSAGDDSTDPLSWLALAVGLLGVLIGVLAWLRPARHPVPPSPGAPVPPAPGASVPPAPGAPVPPAPGAPVPPAPDAP